jgi:hypothetical protein
MVRRCWFTQGVGGQLGEHCCGLPSAVPSKFCFLLQKKFPSVFGGHNIFRNIHKKEMHYVYWLGVEGIIHLHIGVRSLASCGGYSQNEGLD